MSSRTTRGYWKLGAIGCRGASWSKELDDKEPHGAPRSVRASENSRVLDTIAYSCFFYLLHSGVCLFQKIELAFVMQKISTRITPSFSRVLCVRALRCPRLACCRSGCCLFSKGWFRDLVYPKRVFDNRASARVTQKVWTQLYRWCSSAKFIIFKYCNSHCHSRK